MSTVGMDRDSAPDAIELVPGPRLRRETDADRGHTGARLDGLTYCVVNEGHAVEPVSWMHCARAAATMARTAKQVVSAMFYRERRCERHVRSTSQD